MLIDSFLESKFSITDTKATAGTSSYNSSTDIMRFSTNDSGYNLWTSYVWGPVYEQLTKNLDPQK